MELTMKTNSKKMIIPSDLRARHPITSAAAIQLTQHRREIIEILEGRDKRFLAFVGPCSLDDSGAIFEFATKIEGLIGEVSKQVKVVIRANPLKPRTTTGWRGLESESVPQARSALAQLVNAGFPIAIELLAPSQGQYYGDILAAQWIGARNVTDQNVRLQASSMPEIPTLSKNGIFGDMLTAAQAMLAVKSQHDNVPLLDEDGQFSMIDTPGGIAGGIILRGVQDARGGLRSNIDVESVEQAVIALNEVGIDNLGVIIDASHGNGAGYSNGSKSADGQYRAAEAAINLIQDSDIKHHIRGIMLESYLEKGTIKDAKDSTYGYSKTDPTVNVAETETLLRRLADSAVA
jgi:3-deoxy-7-phosphoheptulonate synthase